MVPSEALFGAENLGNAAELPAELIPIAQAEYAKVNFPEYPMWAEPEQPVRWYSAPGQLLRMDGEGDWAWLFVRARTSDDLRHIYGAIPADWAIGDPLLNDS